jgi:hypothetical protein
MPGANILAYSCKVSLTSKRGFLRLIPGVGPATGDMEEEERGKRPGFNEKKLFIFVTNGETK